MIKIRININKIKFSPLRPNSLPDEFIERVIAVREILKDVTNSSLDEWINNFKRDENPERELEIWENIAEEYRKILKANSNLSQEEKKEHFQRLLSSTL